MAILVKLSQYVDCYFRPFYLCRFVAISFFVFCGFVSPASLAFDVNLTKTAVDYDVVFQSGVKYVHKAVAGQDGREYDFRPYLQIGAYRKVSEDLRVGSAVNYAPNTVRSDTKGLLNFKILDIHYLLNDKHSVSIYGGAKRQNRTYTAWGYSLGFGYGYDFSQYKFRTNISWARTNTDIGGNGADTGAKDNLIWLNLGLEF